MDFSQKTEVIVNGLRKINKTLDTLVAPEGEILTLEEFQLQLMLFAVAFGDYMRDLMRVENEPFKFDQVQWIEQFLCTLEDRSEMLDEGYKAHLLQQMPRDPTEETAWTAVVKPVRGIL